MGGWIGFVIGASAISFIELLYFSWGLILLILRKLFK